MIHSYHRPLGIWRLWQASSSGKQDELRRALRRMVLAADAHVADLYSCGRGQEAAGALGTKACWFSLWGSMGYSSSEAESLPGFSALPLG